MLKQFLMLSVGGARNGRNAEVRQSHVGDWSSTVKEVAGHELKARVDVRVERGQMATGQKARTRGSLAVPSGTAAVRGGVSAALDLEVLEDISKKECVRKYRGDARRVQTKGWLHEFR